MASQALSEVYLPRIAIKFCTQCKWNLRAAYYAQELLQTFGATLGEVSLIPVTGGIFTVTMYHAPGVPDASSTTDFNTDESATAAAARETLLWDRKSEGGFPETKELKNRVRNIVDPGRDLGHIDRSLTKGREKGEAIEAREGEKGLMTQQQQQNEPPVAVVEATEEGKAKEVKKKDECEDCQ